ncbi:DUF4407 domain-containing protein [Namhaeicola litoreus]|uniref:DUF4407 domain-containing protein n=1 Tax=Namhaeicola litoreus TaxID=1052145 RepID=A0ABW3XZN8_9FLAO
MLKKFFWMCSGADTDILSDCPKSEQVKFAGIGGTVFFTAVMAFLASAYALYTVFDNYFAAIGFGLIWGLLIFNLDRFIVSTIKKQGKFWKEFFQVVPRIVLAIIISVVIAKPLELKIFEKEIDQVLLKQKNQLTLENQDQVAQQFSSEITRVEGEIKALKNEISAKETEVNNLYDTYIAEAEGREGTLKLGKGPVYKEKREKHDESLIELQSLKETNQAKITSKEDELLSLRDKETAQVNADQPIIDGFDGLMARINALDELPTMPSLFIFLLFLAIETAPILAKLLSPKGAYDLKLEIQESSLLLVAEQQKNQRELLLGTDKTLNEKVYYDVTEDEEVYAHKKQKAKDLLKLQTDYFFKKQKEALGN